MKKIKTKDEKTTVKYKKKNGKGVQEITHVIEYEFDEQALDEEIARLQQMADVLQQPDDNMLLQWARNNHPFFSQKNEIIDRLNELQQLKNDLFK